MGQFMTEITTTTAVVKELGGIAEVARLTGRSYNAAANWVGFDTFPPDTFVVMTDALRAKGMAAPASLWRMVGVAEMTQATVSQ